MRMKQWKRSVSRKKWVAALAAVLTAAMCLFAAAAGRWSGIVRESALIPAGYIVSFDEDAFSLLWDGKEIGTYSLRFTDVTLSCNKTDGLCLQFTDGDGQIRVLTFGEQDSFAFTGRADSVSVEQSVHTPITIAAGARVRNLAVGSAIPVRVEGWVGYAVFERAAKVDVLRGGYIGTVKALSGHAVLNVAQGGTVGKAKGVSPSLTKNSSVPVRVTAPSVPETSGGGSSSERPTRPTIGSCDGLTIGSCPGSRS